MGLPPQNHMAWKVCITLLHLLAISMCVVRLGHRMRIDRLWWDDYTMVIPLVLDVVYVVQLWVKYGTADITWTFVERPDFFTGAWFGSFLYFTITWIPRISLLLSLARIVPEKRPAWILVHISAVLFFIIYVVCVVISTVTCPSTSIWWRLDYDNCFKTSAGDMVGAVVGVVLDFLADVILVVFPLTMLRKVRIPGEARVLVLALFCSSLVTLTASIGYCTVWYLMFRIGPESRLIFTMFAHIQAEASIISANLLIVVMMVYRTLKARDGDEGPSQLSNTGGGSSEKSTDARQNRHTEHTIGTTTPDSSAPSYTVISVVSERETNSQGASTGLGSLLSSLSSSRHSNNPNEATSDDNTTLSSWDFSSFGSTGSRNPSSRHPPMSPSCET